jgi:hypothetical protein
MSVVQRNNVKVSGRGTQPMLFAHGFGCDQNMWRFVAPAFTDEYRVVLFDHVGGGGSDLSAYERGKYGSLHGYAADVLEICDALNLRDVVFVGHSVSAMIGVLAAIEQPGRFSSLVLIGPSPCYLNEGSYTGGFSRTDVQELLDANGNIASEQVVSQYEWHETHNHWHIGDIALFEVRKGSPTGPVVGGNSIKVTFCLIDWYKLDDNSPTVERVFFDCYASYQGISTGWVDQYHQSTEGQQLDLTGVPNGSDYYLVSTSNHARTFVESDYTNNTAWVKFTLTTDSKGNRKVFVTGNSPCATPGLCGANTTNR